MDEQKRREFEVPVDYERKIRTCESCNASIVWIVTKNLVRMPLDVASIEEHDGILWALSHFATCPQAKGWRKR